MLTVLAVGVNNRCYTHWLAIGGQSLLPFDLQPGGRDIGNVDDGIQHPFWESKSIELAPMT